MAAKKSHRISIFLGAMAIAGAEMASAQHPPGLPSVDEIVQKLSPIANDNAHTATSDPAVNKRRTRGLVLDNGATDNNASAGNANPSVQPVVSEESAPQPRKYSESRITFEVDSDRLTPYAKKVLDVFGAAIQNPKLSLVQFTIEGHTDGTGPDAYNLHLSQRRAESVVRYLVSARGIDSVRLTAKGKGWHELVNKNNPAAEENRRVVWISK